MWLCSVASAWGPYGHQQIHRLALRRVTDQPFRTWLLRNETPGLRLSMTPDIDWKVFRERPPNEIVAQLQAQASSVEVATHFFDADIFARSVRPDGTLDLSALKDVVDYRAAIPLLEKALVANRSLVEGNDLTRALIHWNEPLAAQLPSLGTAPWRILNLLEEAVGALERGREYDALVFLTAMGHYVADMAVPHHTTGFYDGDSVGAKGVHLAFEMKTLDWLAAASRSTRDATTQLYPHFAASEAFVQTELEGHPMPALRNATDLFNHVLTLVAEGHAYLSPLTQSYAVAKAAYPDLEQNWAPYLQSRIVVSGRSLSVQQALWQRLAAATRLVSAAYELAHRLSNARAKGARRLGDTLQFTQAQAILDYPFPEYLGAVAPPCFRRLDRLPQFAEKL